MGYDGLTNLLLPYNDKSALAQTTVAFCESPGSPVRTFVGRTLGKIVSARGSNHFGWDTIFEPIEGNGQTYAEMSAAEKDGVSHRGRAFSQFKLFFDCRRKFLDSNK